MNNIPFTKMQGLGNDFVVIDEITDHFALTPEIIRKMSERHFGIGCDQLLIIKSSTHPKADFDYIIYNADGTQVEQCGNGARCVGYYLYTQKQITKSPIYLNTLGGIIEVAIDSKELISVNMGIPRFAPNEIPMQLTSAADNYSLTTPEGTSIHFGATNVGNPHIVIKVTNVKEASVAKLGDYLSHHPAFPAEVNVGFMEVLSTNYIRLRVYERGVGETLACGTGACAAAVVGQMQGLLGKEVAVELPGGTLKIQWDGPNHSIWMTGPAQIVFIGHWPISFN